MSNHAPQQRCDDAHYKDLEHEISCLRRYHATQSFRRFLLAVLKVEYGVDANFEQRYLANAQEALYFRDLMHAHKAQADDDDAASSRKGFANAVTRFLEDFADAVSSLDLRTEALVPLLGRYGHIMRKHASYRSTFAFGDFGARDVAVKLFYDRVHLVEALVPECCRGLRARLRTVRAARQKRYFVRLENLKDYELSDEGRAFDANHQFACREERSCVVQ